MIAKANRFFYATALALIFSNVSCDNTSSIVEKKFGDESFEITVKCSKDMDSENNEKLILNIIEKLTKEINPTVAAKEYLGYVRSIFDKLKEKSIFNSVKDCKSIEESSLKINQVMQEWMKEISSKDNVLKQSVYFVALSDAAIADIYSAMGMVTQSFMIEINTIAAQAQKEAQDEAAALSKEEDSKNEDAAVEECAISEKPAEATPVNPIVALSEEANEKLQLILQEKIGGLGDKMFDAIKDALSKHYTI